MPVHRSSPRRAAPRNELTAVGLVVEGQTEYMALPLLHRRKLVAGCPPLRPSSLNGVGEQPSPEAIAKQVLPKVVAHQVAGRSPIVVCFDRERRGAAGTDLGRSVVTELRRLLILDGRSTDDVFVVVADRAFEAWLLADAHGLFARGVFRVQPRVFCFEGELGARSRLGVDELSHLLGRDYHKTRDGPRVFAAIDFAEARKNGPGLRGSASLDAFLIALGI
jgi:hypothetical protein